MPKTDAVDFAVREPQRRVMHMILGFTLDLLERVIARHADAVRADDRVEYRLVVSRGNVFGEQLAIDLDAQVVAVFCDGERPFLGSVERLAKRNNPGHY